MTEKQVETSSTMSSKDNSELVNLHKLLTEIIPELSFSDTLIDEEMLSIPFVEEFMTELPLELQQQITEQVFANFNSLQEIVDNGEFYLQNPAQLLVIVLLWHRQKPTQMHQVSSLQNCNVNWIRYCQCFFHKKIKLTKLMLLLTQLLLQIAASDLSKVKSLLQVLNSYFNMYQQIYN
ncbi:hypothetical protein KHA80_19770 [Anaerobacillus sp. HL2]|nr:hypothetical protein KHA80_19770 [Anaerobacillus sp. HL2]